MSALSQPRMGKGKKLSGAIALPFASGSGQIAWLEGQACLDTAAYTVRPAAAGNVNLVPIGEFAQSLDNHAGPGSVMVLVTLDKEIPCRWYDNASGGAAVANLFTTAYLLDDHTVTNSSSGNSAAGRVWKLSTVDGVLIEKPWGA